jgi:hypothetical protein
MHFETMGDTRMEEPICGSPDGPCHNNSDLRVVLRKLIEFHGADSVKRVLRSIEAANPVANSRSPGRPAGPAIDDWPSLKKAAAIWRQQGGGPVWPPLIAVGESLPGERESNARRLLTRLLTPGRACRDQFERAGIGDFRIAAWKRKIERAAFRAGSRYVVALFKWVCTLWVHNPDPHTDPESADILDLLHRNFPPLTVEDIVVLTQETPATKIFPFHLIRCNSIYYLLLGSLYSDALENPYTLGEEAITIDELVIVDKDCSIKVNIAQEWSAAKTVPFYVFSFDSVDCLVPMPLAPLDASSN